VLDRFLGKYPEKVYPHEFLRPVINDYVETRLAEGAGIATVRLELSAIRSFWAFMERMEAFGVYFNPANGVQVKRAERKSAGSNTRFSLEESLNSSLE
jgi:site-specific recombinase XerC